MLLTWKHGAGMGALVCTWCAVSVYSNNNMLAFASVGILYFSGLLPTTIVPPFFAFMYTAYCSRSIGGRYLRHMIHPSTSVPHSNFRNGCRLIPAPPGNVDHFSCFLEACRNSGSHHYDNSILVVPTPIFADNYSYLLFSPATKLVAAVDPADPKAILQMIAFVSRQSNTDFMLSDVLCTHKHWDHAGGNEELLRLSSLKQQADERHQPLDPATAAMMKFVSAGLKIIGSRTDEPVGTNVWVSEADLAHGGTAKPILVAGGSIPVRCIRSPGHTRGSLMFLAGAPISVCRVEDSAALFTGDCVFCGGCGAMFEVQNVNDVLTTYDAFHNDFLVSSDPYTGATINAKNVHVYVGHEYSEKLYSELYETSQTMKWKQEPQKVVAAEYERVKTLRKLKKRIIDGEEEIALPLCTVPSSLLIERLANPLLSVKRSALVELRRKEERNSSVSTTDIEKVIYTSTAR
ncbi:lactamase-like protein, putative [Bodo saltans]|uniref:hydroxyacylglutathione hydrolase n=1 Tax=Bodo saltans TaxID=75058 RepID=A0A0S4IM37_BODSA|nr:lactamase-like protein, putative [Bodo saltans]|eukprot:CUE71667.1 lactamase-like protein, putative [Bodo saltans]